MKQRHRCQSSLLHNHVNNQQLSHLYYVVNKQLSIFQTKDNNTEINVSGSTGEISEGKSSSTVTTSTTTTASKL